MTFRQYIEDYCYQRGMFPEQTQIVVEMVTTDKANEAMSGRWNDQTTGYPMPILAMMVMSINRHTITYIEKECPKAWFKPMFQD